MPLIRNIVNFLFKYQMTKAEMAQIYELIGRGVVGADVVKERLDDLKLECEEIKSKIKLLVDSL